MGSWGFYRMDEDAPIPQHVPKGESGMRSMQRPTLSADVSFLPSQKRTSVSISCLDCQSYLTHRSRTRGIVEPLLVFLRIRAYRCEEM